MRLFIKIILVTIFSVGLYAQDCKSKLIVISDSVVVNVFINDSLYNSAKCSEFELPNGKYKIEITEANKVWDSNYLIDSLELNDCENRIIKFKDKNKIYLDSNPQDAYVFLGDSLIGNTPLFINKSYKELLLKKSGYENYNFINDELSNGIKLNLIFNGGKKEESFFTSTTFKILAGTAVALGTVTAYFKLKADKKFDDYKISRDQNLLDQTNRFDLISGITFSALQIDLGFLIYKLFTE